MATAVEKLWEQFASGWDAIEGLITSRRAETLHLEFKNKHRPGEPGLDKPDRENLSIALSGFANAEGGMIVWGVDARPGEDGVDCAGDLKPIAHLRRFVSDLSGVTPEMVSPPVQGVEHRPIHMPGEPEVGAVVTVIPQSDATPHMATGPKLHRYYRRTGNQFREMEHNEVADIFGRRPQPDLRLVIPWELEGGNVTGFVLRLLFMVSNQGRGIARFPCLTIGEPPRSWSQYRWSQPTRLAGPFQRTDAPRGWSLRLQGSADGVIYPGDTFKVATMEFQLGTTQTGEGLTLDAEIVAAGAALSRIKSIVNLSDLQYATEVALRTGKRFLSEDHPDGQSPAASLTHS